ncbi:hypothetical protein [Streptomyces sp. NBC_00102]|uniref:hypothetical protein n=1 Tax=Streptomyces sp. NBC_00102 TaxID=2975652 RepID=UPI00224D99AF|nr:hypothetical protein [Streptomyces sp. NBC_00102]MCX5401772.1 hypothetical protein [Streptomyces sp. NBC_00102]
MATSQSAAAESAPAGAESGAPGSPVLRAAAVTVLAEEPSTGLFPAKPAAGAAQAPVASGVPATVSGSAAPAGTEGESKSQEEPPPAPAKAQSEAKSEAKSEAETEAETEGQPEAETDPEAATGEAGSAVPAAATAATAATTSTAASAGSDTATATATATGGATSTRRTGVLPLGRPGKPLIAAAVAGGLVLVGMPFLISGLSGSGDNSSAPTALTPAGSRMGPDGSGPGFVPGRQNAPGGDPQKSGSKSDGKSATSSAAGGAGTGGTTTDALHESGTKNVPTGSARETPSPGAENATSGKGAESTTSAAPAPTKSSAAKPASPQQEPVAAVTYSHLIGPGCDTPGFATSDQWRDGLQGWVGRTGSQTSYGCSGFYYSVPLSNSTTTSNGYAQWKFPTGSVTNGTCQVSVYIPNVKDITRVGGNPAHYAVHRYFEAKASTQIGTFEIDQPSHLGQWVNAGTFTVSTGKISIVLDNRGKTSGNRHAAAAPIKVNCTAS